MAFKPVVLFKVDNRGCYYKVDKIMSENKEESNLVPMRHSLAHIMASAIKRLWPEAKFGVGPVVENGFYYDIDIDNGSISEDDFATIEKEMREIIAADEPFEQFDLSINDAIDWAKQSKQPYKLELLNDLKRSGTTAAKDIDKSELGLPSKAESKVDKVSFYKNGDFTDLCIGPHVMSTGKVGQFKLMRLSGAYWRGKETNPQMQRIYGVAFSNSKELDDYLKLIDEAKLRDHRRIGQELDLFVISELVGSGLPLFTPRGTVLREELDKFSQKLRQNEGYQKVWVPHIAKKELYRVSGHWDKFGDEWLKVKSSETKDDLLMKPMNCPHHQQIYASQPRSYRELPIKYMETTTVYRDEKAGELMGLARVRAITQDDSHVFCTQEQIYEVLSDLIKIVKEFYEVLDLPLEVRLSFRDESDGYLGDKALWDKAQAIILKAAKENHLKYYIGEGEAAFYGPKIDFMAHDALGRELQVATPQLDFVQPERFGLKYTDSDGSQKTPVMIHFALMGSIERFLATYIEHTAGKFPVWLAPEQIRVCTVNQDDEIIKFADKILKQAKEAGVRATVDSSNESVGKKIRNAEVMKVPYTVVVGKNELDKGLLPVRVRKDLGENEEAKPRSMDDILKAIVMESEQRLRKTSF